MILLGYLIKGHRMAGLIAGYDARRVKDERGLTAWVGGNVMLVGALFCGYGLVPLLLGYMPGLPFHLGVLAVTLGLTIWTAVRAKRFER